MNLSCPTILLTRPASAARSLAQRLRQAGVDAPIITSPLLRIETVASVLPDDLGGVVFTSKNGVAAVDPRDLPAWCVGDATAEAANKAGWKAVSAGGDAEALYRRLLADEPHGPLMHLRGEFARGDLADRLNAAGIKTGEVVVYRQVSETLSSEAMGALQGDSPVLVPLFSPRTAQSFLSGGPFQAPIHAIAISDTVAQVLRKAGVSRVDVAGKPTADAMFDVILARLGAD